MILEWVCARVPTHEWQKIGMGQGGSDPNRENTSPQSRATLWPAKGRVLPLLYLDPPMARSCTPQVGKSPQITPHPDSQWIGGRSPRRGPAPAVGSGCHCGVARRVIPSLSLTTCPPPAAAVNSHCEAAGDERGARLGSLQVYPPEVPGGNPASAPEAGTRAQVPLRPARSLAPPPQLLGIWRHLRVGLTRQTGSGRGGAPRAQVPVLSLPLPPPPVPLRNRSWLGHSAIWWTTVCGTTSRCLTMKMRRTPTSTRPVSSAGGTR